MREQRPVGHAGIAEEAVDPVEKPSEPLGVEPRRQIALRETAAQCRVGVPFGWLVRVCAEDTELSSVEGQGTTASATDLSDRQTARGRG